MLVYDVEERSAVRITVALLWRLKAELRRSTSEPLRDFWLLQTSTSLTPRETSQILPRMSQAAEAAMAASYKALKEDFVSGLTGGEISEVNYVTVVAPVWPLSNIFTFPDLRRLRWFFGHPYNLNNHSLSHIRP
jgi:hypothetical protein